MAKPITGVQQRCILLTLALLEPPACGVTRKSLLKGVPEVARMGIGSLAKGAPVLRSSHLKERRKASKLGIALQMGGESSFNFPTT